MALVKARSTVVVLVGVIAIEVVVLVEVTSLAVLAIGPVVVAVVAVTGGPARR